MSAATLSAARPQIGLRAPAMAGALAAVLLLAVLAVWAHLTWIEGAVHSSGQVVVRGKPKVVQSLDGGVVDRILTANGAQVKAGEVLMHLDPTVIRVNLDIARARLAAALPRAARLAAEDEGREPVFSYPPLPFAAPDTTQQEAGELRIFAARAAQATGRRAQLQERLEQFRRQVAGLDGSIAAREEQLGYIEQELASNRTLLGQGLVRESQVLQLQRGRAEMMGQLAESRAERARIGNAMQDAIIEVEQAEREFGERVATDLRTARTEVEELTLQIITLSRQLERVDIRAPADGVVHEMQVTTLGGVVPPNGTILQVVPVGEGVEIEVMLEPREIDRVHPGQRAFVVFPAFDQRLTPRLEARVSTISPTAVVDQANGKSFYRVGLVLDDGQIERLGGAAIVPGMPIEAFLETQAHSVLSYLLQPLANQVMRAFRER